MVPASFKTAPRCPKMASSRPRWTRTGPIRFQERPKIGDMGQDGSQINPTRSQNYFPLLFCSYLIYFPSLFFSFGEPFPLEKKALVKYPPCIAIVRFSLLYSNYQTLSYCSICQTSLPLYYLPYTSPCITLVTSFPCIVLVYDLSNACSCKTLVKCRPQYHMPLYNTCQLLPCVALVQSSCIISCYDVFSHSTASVHRTGLKNTLRRWQLSQ